MIVELDQPLARHWLAELRAEATPRSRFRELLRSLSVLLFLEAARDLPTAPVRVRTPLAELETECLAAPPVLVPILRAGLGMVEPLLALVPEAQVCHLGMYRDHVTLQPVPYYSPEIRPVAGRTVFLLDPMLGTGGSAEAALSEVKGWGAADLRLLSVIASRPGVARVRDRHPDVPIYAGAIDPTLNEKGYIVPGLGDAGDRQFTG